MVKYDFTRAIFKNILLQSNSHIDAVNYHNMLILHASATHTEVITFESNRYSYGTIPLIHNFYNHAQVKVVVAARSCVDCFTLETL